MSVEGVDGGAHEAVEYSAVVPVFRGAATIEELCRRLAAAFAALGVSYEIILVDDGSSDGSWQRIVDASRSDPRVQGLRLTRNFGQHNATLCGIRHARGRRILTLDEDLQHPPEEMGKLIRCFEERDADVVYGIPEARRHSWWRRLSSRLVLLVPRYVMHIDFDISSFRLIGAPIAREVARAERHDIILDVYFAWLTERIAATHVRHDEATARPSSYTPLGLVRVLANMLYNYTVLPLRVSIVIGALLSAASLLLALFYVWQRLTAQYVPGFSALIVSILFTSGVILLGIGIISEYLAHTFLHVIRKPQSAVRERTPGSASGPHD